MAYNTSKGPRKFGDLINEDDVDTHIDWNNDKILLRTNNLTRLQIENTILSSSVGIHSMGATSFGSSISATGSISGSSTLQAVGNTYLGGTLNVSGTTFAKAIKFTGAEISGSGKIQVVGAITAKGGVASSGSISGSSTLQAVGNAFIGGTLNVTGASTFVGIPTYTAHPIFNSGITIKNADASAGYINFFEQSSNGTNVCTFRGKSSMGNCTITLPGDTGTVVLEDNTVTLSNKTIASPTITGTTLTNGLISSSAGLNIVGASNFGGNVSATGSISGSSTLQAVGNTTLGGTLNVSGATTLAGDLTANCRYGDCSICKQL